MTDSTELVAERYPKEDLQKLRDEWEKREDADKWSDEEYIQEDDGTMPESLDALGQAVIGHKIVDVRKGRFKPEGSWSARDGLALLLDNGHIVWMAEEGDCCAFTEVDEKSIIKHLDQIDHVITGVGTTGAFTQWHIYADLGDILEFKVDWSPGNAFYYGYGFAVQIFEPNQQGLTQVFNELPAGNS